MGTLLRDTPCPHWVRRDDSPGGSLCFLRCPCACVGEVYDCLHGDWRPWDKVGVITMLRDMGLLFELASYSPGTGREHGE